MLDDSGTGGAIHAFNTQVLVLESISKFGSGRLRQFAHPAYAKSFRVIVQAEPGIVLFLSNVHSFHPFGLQQLCQSRHTGITLVRNTR
jgi:hypothetical protein